jgi:hypothetical protein
MCTKKCPEKINNHTPGNLSNHASNCGGLNSIFILVATSKLVYVSEGFAAIAKSPYVNKYGEQYTIGKPLTKEYTMNPEKMNTIRRQILDFKIAGIVHSLRNKSQNPIERNLF